MNMAKQNKNTVDRNFGIQLDLLSAIDTTPLEDFIVTPNSEEYRDFLRQWVKAPYFTLDCETTESTRSGRLGNGLDAFAGQIRLIQIGLPDNKVLIVDLFKDNTEQFMPILKRTLWDENQSVAGQNLYFDLLFLRCQFGLLARNIRDTRILSIVLWCGIKYYRHGLADIYKRLFGEELSKEQQTSDWGQPELSNTQLNYAAWDVVATNKVYRRLCKKIEEYNEVPDINGQPCQYSLRELAIIECECIPAFVETAYNGMPVNIEKALEMEAAYELAINDLFNPVQDKLNLPFSANPAKLAIAIWKEYGIWLLEEDKDADDDYDEDDDDEKIKITQLSLFAQEPLPEIPPGFKLSTSSSTLFHYYSQSNEEDLLRISLVRSIKKCYDTIQKLRLSAQQNGGYAKTRYNPLGSTGTGRSTSGGDKKGTLEALNLQNIPNPVSHPMLDKYNLPKTRDCIIAPKGTKLSIIDLASSHSRYMAYLTDCPVLLSTFDMKDSHLLMTATVFQYTTDPTMTVEKLIERGGKKDPEIAEVRSLAKTCFYLSFNVGGANRLQAVLAKAFQTVDVETCKTFVDAFRETYPSVATWQRNLVRLASKNVIEVKVTLKNGGKFTQHYCQFRTPDGRLFHAAAFPAEKTNKKQGTTYTVYEAKVSDLTSVSLISPEALNMKKAMKRIFELKHSTHHGQFFKPINMCHDEINNEVEDSVEGRLANLEIYRIISETFQESLHHIPGGMKPTQEVADGCLADCYSEK